MPTTVTPARTLAPSLTEPSPRRAHGIASDRSRAWPPGAARAVEVERLPGSRAPAGPCHRVRQPVACLVKLAPQFGFSIPSFCVLEHDIFKGSRTRTSVRASLSVSSRSRNLAVLGRLSNKDFCLFVLTVRLQFIISSLLPGILQDLCSCYLSVSQLSVA